jgi:hypothetical protein
MWVKFIAAALNFKQEPDAVGRKSEASSGMAAESRLCEP